MAEQSPYPGEKLSSLFLIFTSLLQETQNLELILGTDIIIFNEEAMSLKEVLFAK